MRGYGGFDEFISEQGGIVSRRELLLAGWTPDELRIAQGLYGRPTRLRRGWYCSAEVPADVRDAWSHGGPLACVSALRWYGVIPYDNDDRAIHLHLPRHAHRRRVEARTPRPVVAHWHDLAHTKQSRWAVPVEIAVEQARHCAAARAGAKSGRKQGR